MSSENQPKSHELSFNYSVSVWKTSTETHLSPVAGSWTNQWTTDWFK